MVESSGLVGTNSRKSLKSVKRISPLVLGAGMPLRAMGLVVAVAVAVVLLRAD